jgi:hypothetical protein
MVPEDIRRGNVDEHPVIDVAQLADVARREPRPLGGVAAIVRAHEHRERDVAMLRHRARE